MKPGSARISTNYQNSLWQIVALIEAGSIWVGCGASLQDSFAVALRISLSTDESPGRLRRSPFDRGRASHALSLASRNVEGGASE
jgi:hypothetical protein